MLEKLTSRKFWVCIAAFLSSLGMGFAGMAMGNEILGTVGAICAVFAAAIYAACEAAVDCARTSSNTTNTTISAATTAKEVVEKVIIPKED